MHIIVLENEVSSARGGQELSLLDVCRGLHHRGHTISLLFVKEGDLLNQYKEFCVELINVNGYRIENRNVTRSLGRFFVDNLKVKSSKDSIVYYNQYHDSFFASLLALTRNIPSVCHLRLPPPPLKSLGIQWNIGMNLTSQLIAVSQKTKYDWIEKGFQEEKIDVVYNGICIEKFQHHEILSNNTEFTMEENAKIISYIGRIDKDKGIEILLKGFALFLQKSGTKANLFIAGKPLCQTLEYQNFLQKISTDLGIENNVKFLGHLKETSSLYQVSDVTVLPSINSEPFGRCIIESMACKTPVVASRIGGIQEILTNEFAKGLFEPGNPEDLAEKLLSIIKWKESDSQIGNKCRQHIISNFQKEKMIEGVEKVLLKTLCQ